MSAADRPTRKPRGASARSRGGQRTFLNAEALEDRLAPSVDLVFQATDPTPLTLRLLGGDLQVVSTANTSVVLASKPLADITGGARIEGAGYDVSLTIDASVPQVLGGILFDGGAGTNTLVGPARDTTWHLTGPGSGDLGGPGFLRFTGTEGLRGAADNRDTFVVTPGGRLSGVLDGGAGGFDTLVIQGGTYARTTYRATGPDSGTIDLDDTQLRYAGLEPITDNSDTANRVFTGTILNDHMTLRAAGPGQLTIESDNGTFESVTFNDPTESLTVNAGLGDDDITVASLDPAFHATLGIYGEDNGPPNVLLGTGGIDSVTFAGDVRTHGGDLEVFAESITINDGVTLSTTDPDPAGSPGDITFRARRIGTAELENLSPVLALTKSVSIDVGAGATIDGGGVFLIAQAEDRTFSEILGINHVADNFVIGPLAAQVTNLAAMPVKVLLKSSEANVVIRENAHITGTGTVGVYSTAVADSTGTAASKLFSVGYVDATASAIIDVRPGVRIDAGDDINFTSDGTATADISTQTDRDLGDVPGGSATQLSMSLGVANADVTSLTTVPAGVTLHSKRMANVRALGTVESNAEGESGLFSNGVAGQAFAVQLSKSNIQTRIDGTMTADEEIRDDGGPTVKVEFDPTVTDPDEPGYVDYANNTINVGPNVIVLTEDTVTYFNKRGNSIGGLTDGRTYFVIRVEDDPNTPQDESHGGQLIKLAETEQNAIDGVAIDLTPGPIPASLNTRTFDGDAVDPDADTITLDNPAFTGSGTDFSLLGNTFELGQAVIYHQGTAPIPGLEDGETYYVVASPNQFDNQGDNRLVRKQVIKLAKLENEGRGGVTIDIGAPPAGATGYSFSAKQILDSNFATFGVLSALDASDGATASSGLKSADTNNGDPDPAFDWNSSIFDNIFSKLTASYSANSGAGGSGAASVLNTSGAFAFSYTDHVVRSIIGGTADLNSNDDMEIRAELSERVQLSAESDSEPQEGGGSPPNTLSAAVNVGLYHNTATATIESGAHLDALRALRLISSVSYPFLTRPDEFVPSTLGEVVDLLKNDGYDAVNDYLDGTLGLKSKLFNSWARSTAKADDVAVAGSVNFLMFDNVAESHVGTGSQINQDPYYRVESKDNPDPAQQNNHESNVDEQVVSIEATNYAQLFNVTGVFNFQLPSGTIDPTSPKFDPHLAISPEGSAGKRGGFGGALYLMFLDNTSRAVVDPGVSLYSGRKSGLNLKAEEALLNFNFSQSGASSQAYGVGGTFAYTQQRSDTLAQLGAGAGVTGGRVDVYAGSLETQINWAGSVAKGGSLGVGATVAVNDLDRSTQAMVGSLGAPVAVGPAPAGPPDMHIVGALDVHAKTDGTLWAFAVAGARAAGQKMEGKPVDPLGGAKLPGEFGDQPAQQDPAQSGVAVAGAASVNLVTNETRAYVNDPIVIAADGVRVTAKGDTAVTAATGGLAYATTAGGTNAVGLAGAFSDNELSLTTEAFVAGARLNLVQVGGDPLVVEASREGDLFSLAAGAGGAAGGTTTGISVAGSVGLNTISGSTQAFLDHAAATGVNGGVRVAAADSSDILAIGGGLSLTVAGKKGATALAFGVAAAVNRIGEDDAAVRAYLSDTTLGVLPGGAVEVTATSDAAIGAYTLGGAVTTSGKTKGGGVSGTGAGSGSVNIVRGSVEALVKGSSVTAADGGVTLTAADGSEVHAAAGGIAATVGGTFAVGAAFAVNDIGVDVRSAVDASAVNTGGKVALAASSMSEITAVTAGAALDAGIGSGRGLKGSLAGSGSANTVRGTTEAVVGAGSTVAAGGPVTVTAADGSTISATAAAAAATLSQNPSASIGASIAVSDIGNTVLAHVDASHVTTPGGVVLSATEAAAIEAVTVAASVALDAGKKGTIGLAGAGAVSVNTVTSNAEALVTGGSTVSAGNITLTAEDASKITAGAGALALAVALGKSGGAGTVGAAVTINEIDDTVRAAIDSSTATAAGGVGLSATSDAEVFSLTVGVTGSVTGGKRGGITIGVAGSVSANTVDGTAEALVTGSTVTAQNGTVSLAAANDSAIRGGAGAVAIDVAGGKSSGVAAAAAGSVVVNEIDRGVRAAVTDSPINAGSGVVLSATSAADILSTAASGSLAVSTGGGVPGTVAGAVAVNQIGGAVESSITDTTGTHPVMSGGPVALTARDEATITATAVGGAVSVSTGSGTNVSIAVGVAAASNTIDQTVRSFLDNADVTTTAGGIAITAESAASITATAAAASLSAAVGGSTFIAVSGAGAGASNVILGETRASASDDTLTSAGAVDVGATNESDVHALIVAAAGGAGALGASVALNEIGYTTDGTREPIQVQAYLQNSSVAAAGNLTVSAHSEQTIEAIVAALAVGLTKGGSDGLAVAGSGVDAQNQIAAEVDAFADAADVTAAGVSVTADDGSEISALAGAASVAAAYTGTALALSIAVSLARNEIDAEVEADTKNTRLRTTAGGITVAARESAAINATSTAASLAAAIGSQAGLAVSGAGAAASNVILGKSNAFTLNSTLTSAGGVSLAATNDAEVHALIAAASGAFNGFALGASVAENHIGLTELGAAAPVEVLAYAQGSAVTAAGPLSITAHSEQTIDAIVAALAVAITSGGEVGLAGAGSGVSAVNQIAVRVNAFVADAPAAGVRAASVTLRADDASTINALAGATSVAAAYSGTALALSIAASVAQNQIDDRVESYVTNALVTTTAGGITITSEESATINATSTAASLAAAIGGEAGLAVSGAGAAAANVILGTANAYALNSTLTSAGEVALGATNDAEIHAIIAAASGAFAGFALGASVALNQIGVALDGSSAPVEVLAYVQNSPVTATGGLTVSAHSQQTVDAIVAALGVAITAGGDIGLAGAGTGVYAQNLIGARVKAFVADEPAAGVRAASVTLTADDASAIDAVAGSASVAGAFSGTGAVALSVGVSLARNEIDDEVEAFVHNAGVTTTAGGIAITSDESATIRSLSAAASLAAAIAGTAGVSVSGAGAEATNVILGKANAYALNSTLTAAGPVTVSAADESAIRALIVAASGAVGGGGTVGAGVSLGASVALNQIGVELDGTREPIQVLAYLQNTGVTAAGALSLTAHSEQTIQAIVEAFSVAVAGTGTVALSGSGSGVYAQNMIAAAVQATIDGGPGVHAAAVTLTSDDASAIAAGAGAASVAASFAGTVGVAVSLGVALATNEIDNEVGAYVRNTAVTTTGGPVALTGHEAATIDVTASAASIAVGIGGSFGAGVSAAGAEATNTVLGTANAGVTGSTLSSAGDVVLDAANTSTVRAKILTASFGAGIGAGGVGASIGLALARNQIGWDPDGAAPFDYASGDNVLTLHTGDRVKIAGGVRGGDVYQYLGPTFTVAYDYTTAMTPPQLLPGQRVKRLAGPGGPASDEVYEYVGPALMNPNLAAQNYADVSKWHQVTALQQDYANSDAWRRVDLLSAPAQVLAYLQDSSVTAQGNLVQTATSDQTIDAQVFAGSAAISGGSVGVGLSGAGAATENQAGARVAAFVEGDGATGIQAASVTLSAADSSAITANTGAASLAGALGGGGAVTFSLGVGLAFNTIENHVEAYVADANNGVRATAGGIALSATESASIHSVSAAASLAAAGALGLGVAISGAGAEATNVILGTANAYADGSPLTGTGSVLVSSTNSAEIEAEVIAASASLGIAIGAGGAGASLGASVARNLIGHDLDGSESATQVMAYVHDSGVQAGGTYTLTANSHQTIDALVLAISAAIAGGARVGLAGSGSGVYTENRIAADVKAFHDGGDVHAAAVAVTASDASAITASAGAASLAASLAIGGVAVSASLGLSLATNTIDTAVEAYLSDAVSTATAGPIAVSATKDATIRAVSTAASLAVAGAIGVGVAISGAGAEATNVIGGTANAFAADSTLTSAGAVTVTAANHSAIEAKVLTASAGVGIGAGGAGASIGASVAHNFLGHNPDGSAATADVTAYLQNTGVAAAGDLSLTATSQQSIDAVVVAGSVAVAGGAVGLSGSGAGVYTENHIGGRTLAYIAGGGVIGVEAGKVTVLARDASTISANAGSAALAVSFAPSSLGVAVSIGTAVALNSIDNAVEASVQNADTQVKARAGDLLVQAEEAAAISTTSAAAAAAFAISPASFALSAAGASSTNSISTRVAAFVGGSSGVDAAGAVRVTATDTPTVSAAVVAASLSGGLFGIAAGLSLTDNTIGETVSAYIDSSSVTARGGNIEVTSTSAPTITTTGVAAAITISLAAGAGADSRLTIQTTTEAYANASSLTAAGHDVRLSATSTSTAAPTVASAAVGIVSIASLTSEATIAGTTRAYVAGRTTVAANKLDVHARDTNSATPTTTVTGFGGISGTGASATTTISRATRAFIAAGADVTAGGAQVLLTAETPSNFAHGTVVSTNVGGVSISAVSNTVNAGGTTAACVESGARLSAGSLTAVATSANTADADVTLTGIGGITGSGLTESARTTATTSARIESGADVTLGGPATLSATAANTATADATDVSVSAVGVSVVSVTADAGGITEAAVAGTLGATALGLSATSTNTAASHSTAVGVAGVNVIVSTTAATVSQSTDARLRSGADVTLTGPATLTAVSTSTPTAHTSGVSVGAASGAAQFVTATLGGSTRAGTEAGARLTGTSLSATATSTNSTAGTTNVSAGFVGVSLIGGSGVKLTSTVTQATDASLGGTITLTGAAALAASSTTFSTARNDNLSVGGLTITALDLTANLAGSTTAGVADGGRLTAASLTATATGNAASTANTRFVGFSLGGGSGSTTRATLGQTVDARVGKNAVVALGAGAASLRATGNASADASATALSVSGVTVSFMTITSGTGGGVHAFVGDGATVRPGRSPCRRPARRRRRRTTRSPASVSGSTSAARRSPRPTRRWSRLTSAARRAGPT